MARVLLAEDEKDIQFLYSAWLRREGYDVITADNGREAIEAFASGSFDLVVLDVMLLMVSALARPDDIQRGIEAGANLYVDKPVTPKEVIHRIHEVERSAA